MSEDAFVILVERCTLTLSPAWFDQNSVANVRKVFKYLFQEPWRNEDTIAALSIFLAKRVDDAKALWSKKSVNVSEGKRAKATYERYVKKQEIFEKLKSIKT